VSCASRSATDTLDCSSDPARITGFSTLRASWLTARSFRPVAHQLTRSANYHRQAPILESPAHRSVGVHANRTLAHRDGPAFTNHVRPSSTLAGCVDREMTVARVRWPTRLDDKEPSPSRATSSAVIAIAPSVMSICRPPRAVSMALCSERSS
jgi:hypothetical protein